ncbi:MAG TPA: cyclic nucleotide-binding domain-containing protein [Candidatus Sulfotelmatobacter sp.]|nr:cyclic nucleotide-binding domain-containing protein [Candidatus Sulfotelmatobacter sp.]
MSLVEEVEVLRNIPLFANIEPSKLKLLAFTSERLTFQPGQAIMREGELGDDAYVIINGSADVLVNTPAGPLKVASMAKNAFVGEIAMLCDVPRTATIVASSEVVTLRISKELFFRLIREFPQMGIEVMRVLALRLEKTTADLRDVNAKLAEAGKKPAAAT